jgi:hypothetical protein
MQLGTFCDRDRLGESQGVIDRGIGSVARSLHIMKDFLKLGGKVAKGCLAS